MVENTNVVEVVGGIIRRGERYLLGKRPLGKSQGGHWEFIGGKIEPGETPEQALARECREEIALEIVNEKIRTSVTHAYPEKTIHLMLIDCEPAPGAEPQALEHLELCWFTPAEMQSLDFCPADAELLPVLFAKAARKAKTKRKRNYRRRTPEECIHEELEQRAREKRMALLSPEERLLVRVFGGLDFSAIEQPEDVIPSEIIALPGEEKLMLPVSELKLPDRPAKMLAAAGIETVGELVENTWEGLLAKRVGRKSAETIMKTLNDIGLSLREN